MRAGTGVGLGAVLAAVIGLGTLAERGAAITCVSTIYSTILGLGDTLVSTGTDSWDWVDQGISHAFIHKGSPLPSWVLLPYEDGTTFNGYPAIGLEIQPTGSPLPATDDGTDKANITVTTMPLTDASGNPESRYYGFAMKLGNFGVPTDEILIAQWWQGTPYSPPLSLHVIPNSQEFACELQVRNNNTGGNPSSLNLPGGITTAANYHIALGDCTPGVWHTFVFYTRPYYVGEGSGTGEVKVWFDDMTTPVADWTGYIGYNPTQPVAINGDPADGTQATTNPLTHWTVYFGPYRSHQQVNHQTYWANIRFASTFEGANPNQ